MLLEELCTNNEHIKAAYYICGRDRSEGQVQFMARVIAQKEARRQSVFWEGWLKAAAHTGGVAGGPGR